MVVWEGICSVGGVRMHGGVKVGSGVGTAKIGRLCMLVLVAVFGKCNL